MMKLPDGLKTPQFIQLLQSIARLPFESLPRALNTERLAIAVLNKWFLSDLLE
ncbi:hypothetical protein F7734_46700 [Scytonema sp. UIC 10036]|uniref:hypothetical protein n=1 Tax=Scytonema sp. UIC 10036 TaxID=2304196 RepID=UPI0012DA0CC2|nr:hypothetical protein [Scytonema sp. UIC 10036]MUG99385.1 hypothetical protein [Scytonema sp. UIC 10036]